LAGFVLETHENLAGFVLETHEDLAGFVLSNPPIGGFDAGGSIWQSVCKANILSQKFFYLNCL
jgi:hypothetical protein